MTFRLFGFPVQLQLGFAIMAFLVAWSERVSTAELLLRVLVVFVSVLAHELGHALAIRRHQVDSVIQLHWMGGSTVWRPGAPLGRWDHVLISLAGPFAGFLLAGLTFALVRGAPGALATLPAPVHGAIDFLLLVNVFWGVFNLIPVLPLDGGHVLEHALGPKRARVAATISLLVAAGLGLLMLRFNMLWGAMIMGMSAFSSYQRLAAGGGATPASEPASDGEAPRRTLSPAVLVELQRARHALANDDPDTALTLAERLLRGVSEDGSLAPPPPPVAHAALETMAWARLQREESEQAGEMVRSAERLGPVDPALVGAVAMARGDLDSAKRALGGAFARGDRRKELLGPWIQLLLAEGSFSEAAAAALEIVDALSDDDVRRLGSISFEGSEMAGAARLFEALFTRTGDAEDAYAAARALARAGNRDRALHFLERAVKAGFGDAARAWSDQALDVLHSRNDLQRVLPRPESA
jgi:Zn-dependent protease/tetratricopeptide (TPR) repeat protein